MTMKVYFMWLGTFAIIFKFASRDVDLQSDPMKSKKES